jgi:hypothetical protein
MPGYRDIPFIGSAGFFGGTWSLCHLASFRPSSASQSVAAHISCPWWCRCHHRGNKRGLHHPDLLQGLGRILQALDGYRIGDRPMMISRYASRQNACAKTFVNKLFPVDGMDKNHTTLPSCRESPLRSLAMTLTLCPRLLKAGTAHQVVRRFSAGSCRHLENFRPRLPGSKTRCQKKTRHCQSDSFHVVILLGYYPETIVPQSERS